MRSLFARRWPPVVVGVVLAAAAVAAITFPVVAYLSAANDRIALRPGPQQVILPADEWYGIFVQDADNSGYRERCSIMDSDGRRIPLRDPGGLISFNEDEQLDLAFKTGTGRLTIRCLVPGERVTVGPLDDEKPVLIGVAVALVLGSVGVALAVVPLARGAKGGAPRPGAP